MMILLISSLVCLLIALFFVCFVGYDLEMYCICMDMFQSFPASNRGKG